MLAFALSLVVYLSVLFTAPVRAIRLPDTYDVSWTTQSNNSAGSMPLGGGDIGLNVWSENDTILFYIAKSGTFDENNSMLKLGRVRLTLDPNPFAAGTFRQTLKLNDGYVLFDGAGNATMKLWVDVFHPVIHVELEAAQDVMLNQEQSSWSFDNATTYADVTTFHDGGVRMMHHNLDTTVFDFTVAQQHLSEYKSTMYNPLTANTFGLWMSSPDLAPGNVTDGHYVNTNFKAWNLYSKTAKSSYNLQIVIGQAQESTKTFHASLDSAAKSACNNSQSDTIKWWHSFWDRSYIMINENAGPADGTFQVGKNYQIFRFMQGCNSFSEWPLKFNGGLWTFDPVFVNPDAAFTPGYRRWTGGIFTAQNQRLVYWPLLKSGDFDFMKSQFDYYKRITSNAQLRGRVYFGQRNNTANEFVDMILQANMFTGLDVSPYMDFIENQIMWFDQFYRQQHLKADAFSLAGLKYESDNGNGSLVIYPGRGAETYKTAYNPSSTIIHQGNRSYFEDLLRRIPETPLRFQQGKPCISPAQGYSRIQNTEIPQLYPVFPWGEYGLGMPNLTFATNTYEYDTETQDFHGNNQDVIWLARMGLTTQAKNYTLHRWSDSTIYRFPVFKGPNYDWSPDINHFGSASIGLQEMLLQTFAAKNTQTRLMGAWPADWAVKFKLYAPMNTTLVGKVVGGKMEELVVGPKERMGDVVYGTE
ncbi:hypothetical protein BCR34DRAFT_675600 [Clohesyomyces aquaticus]|uniref:DUF5703 domain-containing protein n=1 Tax=Clohesyomyces aquaticus TaxID=1231657 RepID=A0A1Y1Z7C1_9PLEO|nr:hypothetical protein BCR34DRAFT_675600 [Clohesyomyces aquaticus]